MDNSWNCRVDFSEKQIFMVRQVIEKINVCTAIPHFVQRGCHVLKAKIALLLVQRSRHYFYLKSIGLKKTLVLYIVAKYRRWNRHKTSKSRRHLRFRHIAQLTWHENQSLRIFTGRYIPLLCLPVHECVCVYVFGSQKSHWVSQRQMILQNCMSCDWKKYIICLCWEKMHNINGDHVKCLVFHV